jgi:hypothetical protein
MTVTLVVHVECAYRGGFVGLVGRGGLVGLQVIFVVAHDQWVEHPSRQLPLPRECLILLGKTSRGPAPLHPPVLSDEVNHPMNHLRP